MNLKQQAMSMLSRLVNGAPIDKHEAHELVRQMLDASWNEPEFDEMAIMQDKCEHGKGVGEPCSRCDDVPPEQDSDSELVEVRDRSANVALTCHGACRYSNGTFITDPACSTHGSKVSKQA